jgi:hypothetical protein
MNKPSDIYLTEEVENFSKNNPNFNITDLQNEAIFFIIGIFFVFAAYRLGSAGLTKLYSASASSHSESNEKIKAVGVSLVVIVLAMTLFSYLGVFTSDFSLKPLSSGTPSNLGVVGTTNPNPTPTGSTDQKLSAMLATEDANRKYLEVFQGIPINKKACTSVGQTNCTSVGGMGASTLAMLESLKRACNCKMTVTGGTEWWIHSGKTRHQPGESTAVDLSFGSRGGDVSKFIYESPFFKKEVPWSNCYARFSWSGFTFCDEKEKDSQPRHWHIQPI